MPGHGFSKRVKDMTEQDRIEALLEIQESIHSGDTHTLAELSLMLRRLAQF